MDETPRYDNLNYDISGSGWPSQSPIGLAGGNSYQFGDSAPSVPNYMVWSILVIVLCGPLGWIMGLAAALRSSKSQAKKRAGDIAGALADAKVAKVMNLIVTIPFSIVFAMGAFGIVFGTLAVHTSSVPVKQCWNMSQDGQSVRINCPTVPSQ